MVSVQSKLSSFVIHSEKECGFKDCKNFLVNSFLSKDDKEWGRVRKPFRKKNQGKKQSIWRSIVVGHSQNKPSEEFETILLLWFQSPKSFWQVTKLYKMRGIFLGRLHGKQIWKILLELPPWGARMHKNFSKQSIQYTCFLKVVCTCNCHQLLWRISEATDAVTMCNNTHHMQQDDFVARD